MSLLERRLQILLDQDRYDRVARAAEESGQSVGAAIRHAIDVAYPQVDVRAQEALRWLLDRTAEPRDEPAFDVGEFKRELDDELLRKAPR
ncbi:antitoxin [Arsenicicoccus sp. oral taxon 190]|uniref:antitoxin n=1 Tax=Arsenicicoccus sp. oral taxon 190 TaxID=1658671 RepID=UPI000679FFA0|nr:antitoxin [Arsenicicoccus sp. oral taxon 190]AKT52661.1 hypothetical protein ADJ73_07590 [Arsenicicoccus sp. oral taxon 190]